MEVKGNLIKKIGERSGVSQNGPWKIATYLLSYTELHNSFSATRKMTVDVSDGQAGNVARWDSMFGKDILVKFDIDAHEYNNRWFNGIRAWAISEIAEAQPTTAAPEEPKAGEAVDWDSMAAQ